MSIPLPTVEVDFQLEIPDELLNIKEFERKLPDAILKATLEARNFWESLAGQRLAKSREKYIEGIKMYVGIDSGGLELVGSFPIMVETGSSGWDMKKTHLGGPKTKIAEDGMRYLVVPIEGGPLRTMSDASPPGSWRHPGFPGLNLRDEVIKELEEVILPKHIGALIREVL